MEYIRTVRVPVHYLTTTKKLSYLDNLTARLTYAVRLWSEIIERHGLKSMTDCSPFEQAVKDETELSAGFVQQARDKALWMWRSYRELHREWRRMLRRAKPGTKWYEKLLKREPSSPCSSSRSKLRKIPTRFDIRTGEIQKASIKLAEWIVHISTLKKGETVDVLLNPSEWHKEMLEKAEKIKSFQIVKEHGRYYVHILCTYRVSASQVRGFAGVDLGLNRPLSAVLVDRAFHFSILRNQKLERIKKLNDRISHLRRLEKWNLLKKMRRKRLNVAKEEDRMLAKEYAEKSRGYYTFIGHPRYILYHKFRGNGERLGRKMLHGWSFLRQANYIIHEKTKVGDKAEIINEWWTSSRCWKCGAKVKRPKQTRVECEGGHQYDAEFNSCINIAQRGISRLDEKFLASQKALNRAGAPVERARTTDDSALKPPMSVEATHFNEW